MKGHSKSQITNNKWFDKPFDRLTVLSRVEGLTTLSQVEGQITMTTIHNPKPVYEFGDFGMRISDFGFKRRTSCNTFPKNLQLAVSISPRC